MKQFLLGTLIGALLFLCLGMAGLALLATSPDDDAPTGQMASTRCSGLIVSGSCNVNMHQEQPARQAEKGPGILGSIGLVAVVAVMAFGLGAALTAESWREAFEG